jgi:hypothetical protein
LSLDLICFRFDVGFSASLHSRRFTLRPFVSVPVGITGISVNFDDEFIGDGGFYLGASAGLEGCLNITTNFGLAVGYRATWSKDGTGSHDIDGVILEKHLDIPVHELYFGLVFSDPE